MAGLTITCPEGYGETDRAACVKRVTNQPGSRCLFCRIPVALIAADGDDEWNRIAAARLSTLISSSWPRPAGYETLPLEAGATTETHAELPAPPQAPAVAHTITSTAAGTRVPAHKPASRPRTKPKSLPPFKALALALRAAFAGHGHAVGLRRIGTCYRAVPNAPLLADLCHLRRTLARAGLPIERDGKDFFVPINDHTRAFIRSYVKEPA
uniref:Uncharacterized protein n=1 Tax=Desulfovibrio sp. U5L TaxID=596152 RepID=I2Q2L9_9BACT